MLVVVVEDGFGLEGRTPENVPRWNRVDARRSAQLLAGTTNLSGVLLIRPAASPLILKSFHFLPPFTPFIHHRKNETVLQFFI